MSDKKSDDKSTPKADAKTDKQTPETVHLSAEELRKVSAGAVVKSMGPKP